MDSNYLRLVIKKDHPGVVEYHVSYDCKLAIETAQMRKKTLTQFSEQLGSIRSFDGMILFLPVTLPQKVIY